MLEINSLVMEHYKILGVAGKGGMGRVYHALDIRDGSHWAIKEDLDAAGGDFLREEAELLAQLSHPALPVSRGICSWQGTQYMTMQFMSGETLAGMLKKQEKYPETQVLDWFLQICDVLKYLHSRPKPVVYRDLKPSNIIIDEEKRIRIIDFGIAEEYTRQDGGEQMQKGGLTKGFAAPEQYNRRFKADVRTDIYALGVTVHYLLTGKNPTKPPYEFLPVRKLVPDVSPAMEEIVKKCLQPNPDMRYAGADELYDELKNIDKTNRRMRRKKSMRIIAALAVIAIVAAAVFILESKLESGRQKEIDEYYSLVEASEVAALNEDFILAAEKAEKAIAMQPNEISAYLAAANCLVQQGDFEACRKYVSAEILDRFPECYENEDFLELMARMYDRSGDAENALYYYLSLCEINGARADHWLALADCQIRLGKNEDAKTSLNNYLNAGGDETVYRELSAGLAG